MPQKKKKDKIKTHDCGKHASKYAELSIDDTNYLAFRDIPRLIQNMQRGWPRWIMDVERVARRVF